MSDIVPPSLGLAGGVTQTTPAGIVGTVTNPPQAVVQLPSGVILHGTVIRLDGRHRALVRTDLGVLEIASNAMLSVGNQVTLQVRTAGSQLHVVILQVDGHPAHAQPPESRPAAGPGDTNHPGARDGVLALGQRIEVVLQSAPALPSDRPGTPAQVPATHADGRLQARVLQVQGPNGPTLKSGNQTTAARVIQAVVTGVTTSGEPVAKSPLGLLTLGLKAALPSGTRLLLELPGTGLPQHPSSAPPAPSPSALAFGWTTLEQAVEVLEKAEVPQAGVQTARPALQALPRPGPRLTSTILFFLQALSGGDLRGWLGGHAVEALERAGSSDLVSRLSQDFMQLARMSETTSGEWRLLAIPLYDGSQVQQLRLFLRRRSPRSGHDEDTADEVTRFVIEVALARFGDLQMDGLVRSQRFDLILRSRRALSSGMHRDITAIFNDANSAAGQHGQISFQASGDWTFMALDSGAMASRGLLA